MADVALSDCANPEILHFALHFLQCSGLKNCCAFLHCAFCRIFFLPTSTCSAQVHEAFTYFMSVVCNSVS